MVAARWHLGYNTRPPKDNGEDNGHFKTKIQRRQGQETGSEKTRARQEKGAREKTGGKEGRDTVAPRAAGRESGQEDGQETCNENIEIGVESAGVGQTAFAGFGEIVVRIIIIGNIYEKGWHGNSSKERKGQGHHYA